MTDLRCWLRRSAAKAVGGLGSAAAGGILLQSRAVGFDPGSPLRLPGFWDRVVVLVAGLILIGGFVLLLNAVRRKADKRERGL